MIQFQAKKQAMSILRQIKSADQSSNSRGRSSSGSDGKNSQGSENSRNSSRISIIEEAPVHSWGILHEDLEIIELVGKGSFGDVFRGIWRETTVAIKRIQNMTPKAEKDFAQEASVMKNLRPHPHVVLFMGICVHQNQTMIVTEYMPGGNLRSLIESDAFIEKNLMYQFLRGIAAGMLHLSSEGLVHRDLAARNILLTANWEPKVSDFGMSRLLQGEDSAAKTEATTGPVRWMSPESLTNNEYSVLSDVWAFGVVIWELLERKMPYKDLSAHQVAIGVASGELGLNIPVLFPELGRLMMLCMTRDPLLRPKFREICQTLDNPMDNPMD